MRVSVDSNMVMLGKGEKSSCVGQTGKKARFRLKEWQLGGGSARGKKKTSLTATVVRESELTEERYGG